MGYITRHFPDIDYCFSKLFILMKSTRIQAKIKILISFHQVIVTLEPIYGVSMHEDFKSWFALLDLFNFRFVDVLRIPSAWYGPMKACIFINAGWPYGIIIVLVGSVFIYTLIIDMRRTKKKDVIAKCLSWSLQAIIITFYLVLPSFSQNIFDTMTCKSFVSNNVYETSNIYLLTNWNLKCNNQDPEYKEAQQIFWALFVLWLVIIPLAVLRLLLYIRLSIQSDRITSLAEGCQFIWMGYDQSMMFWDVIDLIWKISLTGLVILLTLKKDHKEVYVFL